MEYLLKVVNQEAKYEKTFSKKDGTTGVITRVRVRLSNGLMELFAFAEGALAIEIDKNPLQVDAYYFFDIQFNIGEWEDEKTHERLAATFITMKRFSKL